jgi:hypothetical protein
LKINDVIVAASVPGLNRSDLNARPASRTYGMFGNPNMASHVLFDKPDISLSDRLSVIDKKPFGILKNRSI